MRGAALFYNAEAPSSQAPELPSCGRRADKRELAESWTDERPNVNVCANLADLLSAQTWPHIGAIFCQSLRTTSKDAERALVCDVHSARGPHMRSVHNGRDKCVTSPIFALVGIASSKC